MVPCLQWWSIIVILIESSDKAISIENLFTHEQLECEGGDGDTNHVIASKLSLIIKSSPHLEFGQGNYR